MKKSIDIDPNVEQEENETIDEEPNLTKRVTVTSIIGTRKYIRIK